ncbi:LYR family of Fe/S cluster biogenesis protein [Wolffia australiana]
MASALRPPPSRSEALSLFRSLLRTAKRYSDYNIREYVRRRTIDGFRENRNLADPTAVAEVLSEGRNQLEVAKRQAAVYSIYAPEVKSVMEFSSS